jgi:transcription elongation factor GreA
MVFVGATVKLRDIKWGDEELFRLVGEASGDAPEDVTEVTATSPMGEALMKARVGETVRVDAPKGEIQFEVLEIL